MMTLIDINVITTVVNKYDVGYGITLTETVVDGVTEKITLSGDKEGVLVRIASPNKECIHHYGLDIRSIKSISEFDINDVYLIDQNHRGCAKHLVTGKYVAPKIIFDYCDSVSELSEDCPIYERMFQILESHPEVVKLQNEVIPSYNNSFDGQQGIRECVVEIGEDRLQELLTKHTYLEIREMVNLQRTGFYGEEMDELISQYHKIN